MPHSCINMVQADTSMKKLTAVLRLLRIRQWPKNLFVFPALLFSLDRFREAGAANIFFGKLLVIIGYFFLFCFFSSTVYVLNDIIDSEEDARHPKKKQRPIPSGTINRRQALVILVSIFIVSAAVSFFFTLESRIVVYIYFLLFALYSFALKKVPVLDITVIAFGFLLRAVGGALAVDLPVTRWFLVCIFMASLMIASVKRRSEYVKNGDGARSVLGRYTNGILDLYVFISSASALVTYCIFALSHESEYMFITIPFVLYGMLRYLFVAYTDSDRTEAPDEYIFKDPHLIVTALLFTASIIAVLYVFGPAA